MVSLKLDLTEHGLPPLTSILKKIDNKQRSEYVHIFIKIHTV
jgi:hypothetical protein